MTIAVTGCGYGDGVPRYLSNRGFFIFKGKKIPIVGRVCMDMSIVDVTEMSDVRIGDWVTFLGVDHGVKITADEVAGVGKTIGYEVLTGISKRVKRYYSW